MEYPENSKEAIKLTLKLQKSKEDDFLKLLKECFSLEAIHRGLEINDASLDRLSVREIVETINKLAQKHQIGTQKEVSG